MELEIVQIILIAISGLPFGMILWHYINKPERENFERFWINREQNLLRELKGYWKPEITVCSTEQFDKLLKSEQWRYAHDKGYLDSILEEGKSVTKQEGGEA